MGRDDPLVTFFPKEVAAQPGTSACREVGTSAAPPPQAACVPPLQPLPSRRLRWPLSWAVHPHQPSAPRALPVQREGSLVRPLAEDSDGQRGDGAGSGPGPLSLSFPGTHPALQASWGSRPQSGARLPCGGSPVGV